MMRWRFRDVRTGDLFTMDRNPRAMDSPVRQQKSQSELSPQGVVRVLRSPVAAFPWTFTGRCYSKAEQDALRAWAGRDQIAVRDHIGREHLVIPQGLSATPVAAQHNGAGNPWLYEYTFKSTYLRRLS